MVNGYNQWVKFTEIYILFMVKWIIGTIDEAFSREKTVVLWLEKQQPKTEIIQFSRWFMLAFYSRSQSKTGSKNVHRD